MVSSNQHDKAVRERKIFENFLTHIDWPLGNFDSRPEPEPDILYEHPQNGFIAFELVEICAFEIAQEISKLSDGSVSPAIRTRDPSGIILRNKLSKSYTTEHPIELLCYTAGRVVTPDDLIIAETRPIIECHNELKFNRIWFLGDSLHCLYSQHS